MKNIFITWHYTTHGIAYCKHILSAFYNRPIKELQKTIDWSGLSQVRLQETFGQKPQKGMVFDEIYYLTANQSVFDRIANRKKYRVNMLRDEVVKNQNTMDVWQALIDREDVTNPKYHPDLDGDIGFVKEFFPDKYELFLSQLWRDMHHYTIEDQLKWFKKYSNAKETYRGKLTACFTKVGNLRDAKEIAQEIKKQMDYIVKKYPRANFYINISLGTSETQVVWHALSQAEYLPQNTRFLQTYDNKDDVTNQRFKNFSIIEVPVRIFDEIKPTLVFKNAKSNKRKIANLKMKHYVRHGGFSILILGERGIGKSVLAKEYTDPIEKFVSVNCASFDDDSKAESELFGYEKGAFTGADKEKKGLFEEAKNGILFLDEVHCLSKRVQSKLMKALQTDENNCFSIRKVGSNIEAKVKCTVIFATNRTIQELKRDYLYEDFFDRIAQNIIELPSLRETPEDRIEDWKAVWKHMKFGGEVNDPQLMEWLKKLKLYGNFRDLEKIAIACNNYRSYHSELRSLLKKEYGIKNQFEYAKRQFEELQASAEGTKLHPYFTKEESIQQMESHFKKDLSLWLNKEFGSMEKASTYFKEKFERTIEPRTLYKWKNGK